MRILILALSVFVFFAAHAQQYDKVSGYLGNRFLIGVDFKCGPSIQPQKSLTEDEVAEYKRGLNIFWQGKIEYTIRPYSSIGLSFNTNSTSVVISDDEYINGFYWGELIGSSSSFQEYEHRLFAINGTPLIEDKSFGLFYKKFFKHRGAMAPVGSYIQIGGDVHNYTIDFSNVRYQSSSYVGFGKYENQTFVHKQKVAKAQYFELGFAFGKRIPVSSRLMVDYAMGGGFLFSKFNDQKVIKSDWLWASPTELGVIETKERLAKAHYIKFSLGVSVLLF